MVTGDKVFVYVSAEKPEENCSLTSFVSAFRCGVPEVPDVDIA